MFLQSIKKWKKREVSDNTYIYRPSIYSELNERNLVHTDFYLTEDECKQHWWYEGCLNFGEDRRPPIKQKFGEYLDSIEMSGAELFGSLNIIDAKLRLLELDKD